MVYKGIIERMILENLKQYVILVMILELILLICIQQTINKANWESILKNLKVWQDHYDSNLKK